MRTVTVPCGNLLTYPLDLLAESSGLGAHRYSSMGTVSWKGGVVREVDTRLQRVTLLEYPPVMGTGFVRTD